MARSGINTDQFVMDVGLPATDWRAPTELPDLRKQSEIAVDCETRDDSLAASRGPGWVYGAGHVAGVSWAAGGRAGYIPIRHPDTAGCFDPDLVGSWLTDHARAGVRFLFQNASYDLGWMTTLGVDPSDIAVEDSLAMAFLCNENEYSYSLGDICRRLGIPGKDETLLREAATAYLRPAGAPRSWTLTRGALKGNLWRLPARYVGPYAEADAVATLTAAGRLRPVLLAEELFEAYRLEMDLVPVVHRMRADGIRLDLGAAARHRDVFLARRDEVLAEIGRRLPGRRAPTIDDLQTNKWMEPTFRSEGIEPPRTDKTKVASFTKEWMERHEHWLPKLCLMADRYHSAATKFLQGFLLDYAHRGRLHAEFHQYKSDEGGTVSYRFSISDPPLQQMPSPDINPEIGNAIREVFLAEPGEEWWSCDYSQQEYRLTAHFAAACRVRGGEAAVLAYEEAPNLDYHQMVADMTGLTRGKAKIQNFALLYGQGVAATAAKLGITKDEAEALRAQVSERAPFGPALDEYCRSRATARGYIRLLDGARCRWDEWDAGWLPKEDLIRAREARLPLAPCSRFEAQRRAHDPAHPWHGRRIRRAGVRTAMNRLIQGSAARQTKLAMRAVARAGIRMRLQMHDELGGSGSRADGEGAAEIMRTVVLLRVPMAVDLGFGPNWRAAKGK